MEQSCLEVVGEREPGDLPSPAHPRAESALLVVACALLAVVWHRHFTQGIERWRLLSRLNATDAPDDPAAERH